MPFESNQGAVEISMSEIDFMWGSANLPEKRQIVQIWPYWSHRENKSPIVWGLVSYVQDFGLYLKSKRDLRTMRSHWQICKRREVICHLIALIFSVNQRQNLPWRVTNEGKVRQLRIVGKVWISFKFKFVTNDWYVGPEVGIEEGLISVGIPLSVSVAVGDDFRPRSSG